MVDGILYSCDAGIHPGWPNNWSKATGQVFRKRNIVTTGAEKTA